jgi:hypothetical protein
MAKQAAMQAATKDEDLLSTLQGVLAARMPPGSRAPPDLCSKVAELASYFDDLTAQHAQAQAPGPRPRDEEGSPAVGQCPEDGPEEDAGEATGAASSGADAPPAAGQQANPAEHVPTPTDAEPDDGKMDESESLVRAASALQTVASGMAEIQGENGPEAKRAKAAAASNGVAASPAAGATGPATSRS